MIDVNDLARPPIVTVKDGDTIRGKWIDFIRTGVSDSGKTELWLIRPIAMGSSAIAEARWYGPWRCYAMVPGRCTVFEARCLREIALFLRLLNAAHRANRGKQ